MTTNPEPPAPPLMTRDPLGLEDEALPPCPPVPVFAVPAVPTM